MSQHDYVIANDSGANVRTDLNNVLAAILTNNSGASEPSTKSAYMFWFDTTTGILKIRNATNDAWVEIGSLATLAGLSGRAPTASPTFTGTVVLPTTTLGEVSFQLDPTISADGKWSGVTETGTAGATLAFGDLCYYAIADSRWELAKADAAATSGGVKLGMCVLAAAGDGSATEMLLYGKINAAAKFPTLTVGAVCYISAASAGLIVAGAAGATTGQPTGTDNVIRIVGWANTADELFFAPDTSYITHV